MEEGKKIYVEVSDELVNDAEKYGVDIEKTVNEFVKFLKDTYP